VTNSQNLTREYSRSKGEDACPRLRKLEPYSTALSRKWDTRRRAGPTGQRKHRKNTQCIEAEGGYFKVRRGCVPLKKGSNAEGRHKKVFVPL